jgi:hypothetical protein
MWYDLEIQKAVAVELEAPGHLARRFEFVDPGFDAALVFIA